MLSISDSCSWNLVPCALLRSGVCSTSDVVGGLAVVWHFQMIYSSFVVIVLCIDCYALHRASNFNFSAFVFVLMVEAQQQVWVWWKTDTTSRRSRPQEKMQVGKKGKELKGRNCEKVPSPARCALRTSSTVGTT